MAREQRSTTLARRVSQILGVRVSGRRIVLAGLLLGLAVAAALPGATQKPVSAQAPAGGGRSATLQDADRRRAAASTIGPDSADPLTHRADARKRRARARLAARRRVAWRTSTALGTPSSGRLVRGVQLPLDGEHFFTWDPVQKRSPNRQWRRHGTDRLVRVLLRVSRRFAAAHRRAPRLAIGDLSRPHGGDFGRRFGPVGHVSHQNGLDADVYLPRVDGRERAPRTTDQVDRALAQRLVDGFVRAGAQRIFVGPSLGLTGPAAVVQPWPGHDDHLHVRLAPGPSVRRR